MIFILVTRQNEEGKLNYYTKDKKFVDKLTKDAILDYYTANKEFTSMSKTSHKDLRMINILDLIPQLESHIVSLIR